MNKKLYRSRNDKALSGVCAGIADYLNIDVIIVRLLAVILGLMSFGTMLVAYILAAILVPEEPACWNNGMGAAQSQGSQAQAWQNQTPQSQAPQDQNQSEAQIQSQAQNGSDFQGQQEAPPIKKKEENPAGGRSYGTWVIGVLLIAMGLYLILDWLFPWVSWRIFGAVILIVLGLLVIFKK